MPIPILTDDLRALTRLPYVVIGTPSRMPMSTSGEEMLTSPKPHMMKAAIDVDDAASEVPGRVCIVQIS